MHLLIRFLAIRVPTRPLLSGMSPSRFLPAAVAILARHRKRRIPKLFGNPEIASGRYYTCFRDESGRPGCKIFSTNREASEVAGHPWVVDRYDHASAVVSNDGPGGTAGATAFESRSPRLRVVCMKPMTCPWGKNGDGRRQTDLAFPPRHNVR